MAIWNDTTINTVSPKSQFTLIRNLGAYCLYALNTFSRFGNPLGTISNISY